MQTSTHPKLTQQLVYNEALFAHVNTYIPCVVFACDQRLGSPLPLPLPTAETCFSVSHHASFLI